MTVLHESGDDLVSHEQVGSHPSKEGEGSRRLHWIQISLSGLILSICWCSLCTCSYCFIFVFQYNLSLVKLCSVWWPWMRMILLIMWCHIEGWIWVFVGPGGWRGDRRWSGLYGRRQRSWKMWSLLFKGGRKIKQADPEIVIKLVAIRMQECNHVRALHV